MNLAGALLAGVERTLVPVDALRRVVYRRLVPWLGPWIRDREVRVGIQGMLVVLGSLIGAVLAPLWMLALGPLSLGVPHLLADLRYLVVQPGLFRRRGALLVGSLVLMSSFTTDLRWGLAAVVLVPLLASGSVLRRLVVVVPALALFVAGFWALRSTQLVVAHGHNLVAVGLWVLIAVVWHEPRAGVARGGPLVAFLVGVGLVFSGALDPWMQTGFTLPGGPGLQEHLSTLAPGLEPVWAVRWVVAFAYAQAVHYGLWLRVIPEEARRRPSPRSWKASLAALRRDFGDRFLAFAVVLTVGIAVWGVFDLIDARLGYLRLALFHGPLEFCVLALVAAEGRGALRS